MQLFKEKEERQNQLKNTLSRQNITFLNFPIEKFAHFKGIVYFCTQSYVIGTVPNGMKGVLKLSCIGIWTIPPQKDNRQGAHVSLDICKLLQAFHIPIEAWAFVCYFCRAVQSLDAVTAIVPTPFLISNSSNVGRWE